jgi:Bacterial Ig domain
MTAVASYWRVLVATVVFFLIVLAGAGSVHRVSPDVALQGADVTPELPAVRETDKVKAPQVVPPKPFDLLTATAQRDDAAPLVRPAQLAQTPVKSAATTSKASASTSASAAATVTTAAATDTPVGPTSITAGSQSLVQLTAQWPAAQDTASGVSYYVFGVGTVASGDYSTLANIRWWQVTYDTSVTLNMGLDPSQTYYVSVYAVNGAGVAGPIVTSNAVHPVWQTLGASTNVMQIAFASQGYDANGAATSGWTAAQVATMSGFFSRMYPILVQLYGPPALNYTVTIVRDLRYHNSNAFIPSMNQIRMDDTFTPQLFTHELIHAFRGPFVLTSDQNWNYDPTLSGFEEGFAQAVSYEAMNQYVVTYPNDPLVPANSLWGSSDESDYDFQNVPELRGTDFWSDGGGTLLYWTRYEMAAAAIRKIEIESPGFYSQFNQAYYARLNANPTTVRPSQALIVSIIKGIVPTIEGIPADTWIAQQNIFYDQNVYGDKIFHQIQDYPTSQFFAFQKLFFLDTMSCGSEWVCLDGQTYDYYDLNGSQGTGTLVDDDGNTVWSGGLTIQPTQNPADGNYMIGDAVKNLTTASTLQPWPGGSTDDYVMNLTSLGLYKFTATFTDPNSGAVTTSSVYRVLGAPIANNFKGVWGGVIGHKTGTIYLDHAGYPAGPGIPVTNGAFAASRSWTGIPDARTGGFDSAPGKVTVTFVDGTTGVTYHAQRDIDTGDVNGSEMFLFDFSSGGDTTSPTVSVSGPQANATVFGTISLQAGASDDKGVASVRFLVDGNAVGAPVTSAPYSVQFDTTTVGDGTHTVTAVATDTSGNTTTSSPVSFVTANAPPSASVSAPLAGTAVTGTVSVAVTASSGSGIGKVEVYRDGSVLIGTATSSPYTVSWNTAGLAQGSAHTISARAYAGNGKTTDSAAVTVSIKDTTPPTVSLTSPANGSSTSSSSVSVSANASDNVGVSKVEFYVDGTLLATDTASPYTATWDSTKSTLGTHVLTAKAYDQAGNSTVSAQVSVKATDTTAPTVTITSPANGAQVSRSTVVAVAATASDNRAVSKVEFSVNGTLRCTDTAAPYTCNWSVPSSRGVRYTLAAKAYDASNNATSKSITVTSR